jgi:hypothetical protein
MGGLVRLPLGRTILWELGARWCALLTASDWCWIGRWQSRRTGDDAFTASLAATIRTNAPRAWEAILAGELTTPLQRRRKRSNK